MCRNSIKCITYNYEAIAYHIKLKLTKINNLKCYLLIANM